MSLTPKKRSNIHLKLPEQNPVEEWWEGSSSSEEESGDSEYDCGYLNLGAETPASESTPNLLDTAAFVEQWAAAGVAVPRVPTRRRSWQSQPGKRSTGLKSEAVDRDCGICFEYAVNPCRTLCCGKIFCTEHLADWLHGPNAEGRCPNCENACSLEGGTLSLVPPALLPASHVPSHHRRYSLSSTTKLSGASLSSPLTPAAQPRLNDAASGSPKAAHAKGFSSSSLAALSADSTSTSSSSTIITASEESEDWELNAHHKDTSPFMGSNTSSMNLSTTPFSTSWGAVSRLMSIITFLMFLYKLLS